MIKIKDREKEPEKKEYDFDYCPKHNIRYPKVLIVRNAKRKEEEMIDFGSS